MVKSKYQEKNKVIKEILTSQKEEDERKNKKELGDIIVQHLESVQDKHRRKKGLNKRHLRDLSEEDKISTLRKELLYRKYKWVDEEWRERYEILKKCVEISIHQKGRKKFRKKVDQGQKKRRKDKEKGEAWREGEWAERYEKELGIVGDQDIDLFPAQCIYISRFDDSLASTRFHLLRLRDQPAELSANYADHLLPSATATKCDICEVLEVDVETAKEIMEVRSLEPSFCFPNGEVEGGSTVGTKRALPLDYDHQVKKPKKDFALENDDFFIF